MAIGKQSDLTVYDVLFNGSMYERIAQNIVGFNAASAGCLVLNDETLRGQYKKTSFWSALSGAVTRRDLTSVATASDSAATQSELISVKIDRKFGPYAHAIGALKSIDASVEEWFEMMGGQYADWKLDDQLNQTLNALVAAITVQTAVCYDATTTSSTGLTHNNLVSGMALFGDKASKVKCWVMHSKPFYDLVGDAISGKVTNVADVVIYGGGPGTLGKPVLVTDSSYLTDTSTSTTAYHVLGLVEGAAVATQSAADTIANIAQVTGLEQISCRSQAEFDYNLALKGFTWDATNGGANPTSAAIGTGTNWDMVATANKDLAGVLIKVV